MAVIVDIVKLPLKILEYEDRSSCLDRVSCEEFLLMERVRR